MAIRLIYGSVTGLAVLLALMQPARGAAPQPEVKVVVLGTGTPRPF